MKFSGITLTGFRIKKCIVNISLCHLDRVRAKYQNYTGDAGADIYQICINNKFHNLLPNCWNKNYYCNNYIITNSIPEGVDRDNEMPIRHTYFALHYHIFSGVLHIDFEEIKFKRRTFGSLSVDINEVLFYSYLMLSWVERLFER